MSQISTETVPYPIYKEKSEQLISAWRPRIKHLLSHCSGGITEQFGTAGTVRVANLQNAIPKHGQAVGIRVAGLCYFRHFTANGTRSGGEA